MAQPQENDGSEFDPDKPENYPCANGGDCGCVGTGLIGCPGRVDELADDEARAARTDLPPGVTLHPDGGTIEHADGVHPRHGGTPTPIPLGENAQGTSAEVGKEEEISTSADADAGQSVVEQHFTVPRCQECGEPLDEGQTSLCGSCAVQDQHECEPAPDQVFYCRHCGADLMKPDQIVLGSDNEFGNDLVTPTGILVSDADPGTPEWLAARREGITATDLPMILDLNDSGDPDQHGNQYGNALSVWADKTGRLPDSAPGEPAEWGHIHEPAIAARWERLHGVTVRPVGIIAHQNHQWQRCSLDRIVDDCPDGDGPCSLEIKTRSAFKAGVFRDDVPDDVLAQVTWQLAVSGYQHSHVAVLLGGNRMIEFRVDRDPAVERLLLASAQTVWGHVLTDTPPPADPSPVLLRILDAMHPDRAGQTEVDAETWAGLLEMRQDAAKLAKQAKQAQAAAKAAIVAALADGDTLTVAGRPVVTYAQVNRRGYTVEPTTYRQLKISGGSE